MSRLPRKDVRRKTRTPLGDFKARLPSKKISPVRTLVVKRDGRVQRFNRTKLTRSITRAEATQKEARLVTNRVASRVAKRATVPSRELSGMTARSLSKVNTTASRNYARFRNKKYRSSVQTKPIHGLTSAACARARLEVRRLRPIAKQKIRYGESYWENLFVCKNKSDELTRLNDIGQLLISAQGEGKLEQKWNSFVNDNWDTIYEGSKDADIMSLLFSVFRHAIEETNQDKQYWLEMLKKHKEMGEALSDHLRELMDTIVNSQNDTNESCCGKSKRKMLRYIRDLVERMHISARTIISTRARAAKRGKI